MLKWDQSFAAIIDTRVRLRFGNEQHTACGTLFVARLRVELLVSANIGPRRGYKQPNMLIAYICQTTCRFTVVVQIVFSFSRRSCFNGFSIRNLIHIVSFNIKIFHYLCG